MTDQPPSKVYMTTSNWQVSLLGVFLVVATIFGVVIFGQMLLSNGTPQPDTSGEASLSTVEVPFLFWTIGEMTVEVRLLLLVIISGALGGLLRSLSSFAKFVGTRTFVSSWITHYYFQPLIGALLALIFYLVIRGGFFRPGQHPRKPANWVSLLLALSSVCSVDRQ